MTCTGFSHDGKYAATGDMGGGVRVWSVEERQPVCVFESSDIEVSAPTLFVVFLLVSQYTEEHVSL